ncbi:MAG TPA: cation transporter [Phycisphaerales bacterium]|nr:cation transporter [Phycisphaerales bacterium]
MNNNSIESDNRQIRNVTYAGIVTNVALAAVKMLVGLAAGSIALVADSVHSLSDMVTDIAVLLGVHLGSRGPDSKHPYGHGRRETFSSLFVAVILIVVGGFMIYRASLVIARLRGDVEAVCVLGWPVYAVAVVSIVLKEMLYQATRRVAVRTHSSVTYANAWHHRSDALSSVAVLIGLVAMKFGYVHGDSIAAVAVGLMIIFVGVRIVGKCIDEFAEAGADEATVGQIESIIGSEQRIRQWHKLRTRSVGREVFLDLHILVDPNLSITDAHEIAESLESSLHDQIVRPVNITVHVEPDLPQLRK